MRELDVFLRVAELTSFSAVARSLNCDPSTISKIIQRLENRLAMRLFNRTSRSLSLTQDGQRLREAAQRVAEALDEVERVVSNGSHSVTGSLRINTSGAFAQSSIVPYMRELGERHPGLKLELLLTATPVDMVASQVDVSIRSGYIADSSLIAKYMSSTRWFVCASPDYLSRRGVPTHPKDLASHNCLGFLPTAEGNGWPMRIDETGKVLGIAGNVESNSPDLLRSLAREGMGIVRLSELHVGKDIARGDLVPLLEAFQPEGCEPIFAVYPSKRHLSPRLRCFLEFMEEKLGSHGPSSRAGD